MDRIGSYELSDSGSTPLEGTNNKHIPVWMECCDRQSVFRGGVNVEVTSKTVNLVSRVRPPYVTPKHILRSKEQLLRTLGVILPLKQMT